ncbi:MAG: hypothetical protein AAGF11_56540 [Myxococcota bacterium]
MNGDPRPFWEKVERTFDYRTPVRDLALFAERDPEYDPLSRLERRLRRPSDHQKYLVTGTVGNGKTSALFHLSANLARDRMVVFFDVYDHFVNRVGDRNALERLEPWELLGLLGLAVIRAGEERFGHRWGDEPKALEKALGKLRKADGGESAEINVVKLARSLAIAAGGVVGSVAGGPATGLLGSGVGKTVADTGLELLEAAADATSWSWRIGFAEGRGRKDQDAEIRELLGAVNGLIMRMQQEYGRRLLLVVDGIDRVQEPERLDVLFVDSSLLGELACDEVFTAPQELLSGGAARRTVAFRTYDHCNVPVLSHTDPTLPGPGLPFFREVVRKRMTVVEAELAERGMAMPSDAPIPEHVVDRLAYYSGGLVRDFVRMVAFAASEAWEAQVPSVTDEIVDETLRDARSIQELRITSDEIVLLEQVMRDPKHKLPTGELAREQLRQQRLLPFPNETPWYYPNPLLTLAVLKPGPRRRSAP